MKNVNKERQPINLEACGSDIIYSIEYKWTREETPQTTSNIVELKESKQKDHGVIKSSILIQEEKKTEQTEPNRADSKKAKSDNINASKIEKVDKNLEPETPIKRPNKLDDKKPKKGKSNISKNILKY